jgi:hypothetical protein
MKQHIKEVAPCKNLYRDTRTGLAWIEDGSTGCGHSCHPNIDASGSVRGMKKLGYWAEDARTVRSHGFVYNIDRLSISDKMDEIAREHCQCGGRH